MNQLETDKAKPTTRRLNLGDKVAPEKKYNRRFSRVEPSEVCKDIDKNTLN